VVGLVVLLHILLGLYWCVCGALFRMNSASHTQTHTNVDLIKYAATPLNQPQRCILTNYFNNYNFSKAQIICSLMMVIELKHVKGAVLM
jgi:hypothetical protein